MKKILIAGATGLIGSTLSPLLEQEGYQVIHLSRNPRPDAQYPTYQWNLDKGYIEEEALDNIDYIINLAGANVAEKRWTKNYKKTCINSRVKSTSLFAKYIVEERIQPKAYISASAIGIYGHQGDQLLTEESPKGEGFLAECTHQWENAIQLLSKTGVRTVGLRIGIVLSKDGGALEKMALTYPYGFGNWFGDGKQYYSWIHIDDVSKMFQFVLENETIQGFFNAVAPQPVTNKDLMKAIKKVKNGKQILMPVPAFILKTVLGEMSSIVLDSMNVSSKKIEGKGFEFEYSDIESALKNIYH